MSSDSGQSLPRELASLLENYDRTLDEYEAERLTYEQADATIKAQGAFDGKGRRWSVNEHRQFQVDDPAAGQTAIHGPEEWVDSLLLLSAGADPEPSVAQSNTAMSPIASHQHPEAERGETSADTAATQHGGPSFWTRNRTPFVIGTIVVAVVGSVFLMIGGSDTSSEPAFTVPQDTVATSEAPSGELIKPTDADVTALVGRFLSGTPETVEASVNDLGSPYTKAAARTFWVGASTSGVVVEVSPGGKWTISDDGVAVAEVSVSYVSVDGEWKLAEWPNVSATAV